MIHYTQVNIYSDQPTTCPMCSARTDIVLDLSHTKNKTEIHKCLHENCSYEFVMGYDEEFEEYDLKVMENEEDYIEIFT